MTLIVTCCIGLLILTSTAYAVTYTFTTIDDPEACTNGPGCGTTPTAINNSGQAVGSYVGSEGVNGFMYSGGQFTSLAPPGGYDTRPGGINDSGQVVGTYTYEDTSGYYEMLGFLYSGGQYTTLDAQIPNTFVDSIFFTGINNDGEIVGDYDGLPVGYSGGIEQSHGFLYTGGQFTTFDDPQAGTNIPGCLGTYANGINDNGQVVGNYYDSSGNCHGFLDSSGQFTTLDNPNASLKGGTQPSGINNKGQVVGTYYDSSGIRHGFLYGGGQFTTLDAPEAGTNCSDCFGTVAASINDSAQIVGNYYDSSGTSHGFIAVPTYSISGTVAGGSGSPLKGVTVALSGISSSTTQTASKGTYSFPGLSVGSYTVTASMAGYSFKAQKVTITNQDVPNVNFSGTAVYLISGTVTLSGHALAGVTITLSGTAEAVVTKGASGTYSLTGLTAGSYTLTPSMSGYTFSPPNVKVTLNKTSRDVILPLRPCQSTPYRAR
ncbi:MAG: carboxypeptidase regulatory-like domain-containing protein [Syntrophobacteraceae bacterium]